MAGHAPLQIGSHDGIDIEMTKMEAYRGRPIPPQLNRAINVQFRRLELRLPAHPQVGALGDRVELIITSDFMVKGKIAQLNLRINGRLLQGARSLSSEIHATVDTNACGLKLRDSSQIEVVPRKVDAEGMAGKCVSARPADARVIVCEMKVVQRDLVA